jgi:hypothetical protein
MFMNSSSCIWILHIHIEYSEMFLPFNVCYLISSVLLLTFIVRASLLVRDSAGCALHWHTIELLSLIIKVHLTVP